LIRFLSSAPQASIILCGWKAVVQMGADRFCCKLVSGAKLERKEPSMLKTLILCLSEPLLPSLISCEAHSQSTPGRSQYVQTYVAKTGACSCTLKLRKLSFVATTVLKLLPILISHNLTSPFLQPLTSSRCPPLCKCTLVTHCECSFHFWTWDLVGFSRWS